MFQEPKQRLTRTSELPELRKHQADRLLHALVGILFESLVICFQITDWRHHNQLPAPCLLVAGGKRPLTQKIQFVLVEAALQAEKKTVIALAWCIDRLLIDKQRIDHTAHLDQLLPVPAVPGKARDFARRHRPNFARQTSATIRSKPVRMVEPAAERPRSSSTTSISRQPSARSRSRIAYCRSRLS